MNKTRWFLVFTGVMAATVAMARAEEALPSDISTILLNTRQLASEMPTPASRPVNEQGALDLAVPTSDLIGFVQRLSQEERTAVISKTASMMGGYFKNRDFTRTDEVRRLLSTINADSGYALYFEGEILRKTGKRYGSHASFEHYLAHEKTLPASVAKTGPEIKKCYQDDLGYCQQRTAWICHLLANDYFVLAGMAESDRKDNLRKAAVHAQCALDNYPPKGFDAMGSLFQTVELQDRIKTQLAQLQSESE